MSNRSCFYVPADAHVKGEGFRVSIVKEDESGHFPTGDWPYRGGVGQTRPYFWGGDDYEAAKRAADAQNEAMGISKQQAAEIVASSMRGRIRKPSR